MTTREKTLTLVTKWSAETPDGTYYAERSQDEAQWTLHKIRGRGKGIIGHFSSLDAAQDKLMEPTE